jgi:hypothetical protein
VQFTRIIVPPEWWLPKPLGRSIGANHTDLCFSSKEFAAVSYDHRFKHVYGELNKAWGILKPSIKLTQDGINKARRRRNRRLLQRFFFFASRRGK